MEAIETPLVPYWPTKPDDTDVLLDTIGFYTEYCQWVLIGAEASAAGTSVLTFGGSFSCLPALGTAYSVLEGVEIATDMYGAGRTLSMIQSGDKTPADFALEVVDLTYAGLPVENTFQDALLNQLLWEIGQ